MWTRDAHAEDTRAGLARAWRSHVRSLRTCNALVLRISRHYLKLHKHAWLQLDAHLQITKPMPQIRPSQHFRAPAFVSPAAGTAKGL